MTFEFTVSIQTHTNASQTRKIEINARSRSEAIERFWQTLNEDVDMVVTTTLQHSDGES